MDKSEQLAVAPALKEFKNEQHKRRFFNRLRSFRIAGPRDKNYITRLLLKYAKKILDYLGTCQYPQSGNDIRKAFKLQYKSNIKRACRHLHRQGKIHGAMKGSAWFYWVGNAVGE